MAAASGAPSQHHRRSRGVAQEAAIRAFLGPADRLLEPIHVEIESGRNADRPKLVEAIARSQDRCDASGRET
jgi:hypothetical protein